MHTPTRKRFPVGLDFRPPSSTTFFRTNECEAVAVQVSQSAHTAFASSEEKCDAQDSCRMEGYELEREDED